MINPINKGKPKKMPVNIEIISIKNVIAMPIIISILNAPK